MARRVRRTHNAQFKVRVALAALREDRTMAELCQEFDQHVNQIADWKRQVIERAADAFDGVGAIPAVDLVPLQAKIGQLTAAMAPQAYATKAQLPTLQRRVKAWRVERAKEMVLGSLRKSAVMPAEVLRGGTAINKLLVKQPLRCSEAPLLPAGVRFNDDDAMQAFERVQYL